MSSSMFFADARLVGRVEAASETFPGDQATYTVVTETRSGRPVTHSVLVESGIPVQVGDVVRVAGELTEEGVIVVGREFGEFTIVIAPAAVVRLAPTTDTRPTAPRPAPAPAMRPARPAGFGSRPAAPVATSPRPVAPVALAPVQPETSPPSSPPAAPASSLSAVTSRPAATPAPSGPRPAFGRGGMMARPGTSATPAQPAATPTPVATPVPSPSVRRGGMLAAAAEVSDEPPTPAAAAPSSAPSPGASTTVAALDEVDKHVPW